MLLFLLIYYLLLHLYYLLLLFSIGIHSNSSPEEAFFFTFWSPWGKLLT